MINLNELNNGRKFTFSTANNIVYKKLIDCDFDVAIVRAVYINEGVYGETATAIVTYSRGSDLYTIGVNLPQHQLKNVKKILNDYDFVDLINSLGLSIKPIKYHSNKYNKDCMTLEWVYTSSDLKDVVEKNEIPF